MSFKGKLLIPEPNKEKHSKEQFLFNGRQETPIPENEISKIDKISEIKVQEIKKEVKVVSEERAAPDKHKF